jgi:retron-type reverse transcriptase
MKRYGDLWPALTSFGNLYEASLKARRGKRHRAEVERFEFELERSLTELREELQSKTYRPGPFRTYKIIDPKPRTISAAPYRDRVVHHALCNVLEPIFERSFIFDSYACRKGKGTHAAVDRYTQFARCNRYVLTCDVRKFFPSIDHQILLERLARKIKDPHVLWLAEVIVAHSNPQEPVPWFFPGDDLFTAQERPHGLPIGNQTSQFFANVYLDALDHFVKETLRCRRYVRYCDDFVLLDGDKRRLAEWRDAIEAFLRTLRLWLHPTKRVISRTEDGIRFLGYRVFPDHRLLDQGNVRRFKRRMRRYQQMYAAGQLSALQVRQRIVAWVGHAQHADTWRLRRAILGSTVFSRAAARCPRVAGWFLEQQPEELPLGQSQQERAGQP